MNNIAVNNCLIWMRLESKFKKSNHPYLNFKPIAGRSLQKIAGFSESPEINEVIQKIHQDLQNIAKNKIPVDSKILDIGCGPGLYLKDFDSKYKLTGIDFSKEMIIIAQQQNPNAQFINGDFLELHFDSKYNLIYSIGVLEYISRMDVKSFIKKTSNLLEKGGILFLNYPHASSFKELFYPNRNYLEYSPVLIEKIAKKHFNLLEHHHALDARIIKWYDKTPYKSLNSTTSRTFRNSYLLIAQKN